MSRSRTADTVLSRQGPSAQAGGGDAVSPTQISLSPTGKRKMKFNGREIARAANPDPDHAVWHEITLYRRDRGGVVLALRKVCSDPPATDIVTVWRAGSAAEAMAELDAYDAGGDVPVGTDPEDPGLCPAEMAAAAEDLRAQVESCRHRFAGLRADLLEQVEASGRV